MSRTIIALATPPVPSALAIIRMSGSLSHEICRRLSGHTPVAGRIAHRSLRYQEELIDDVIILTWKSPASFTGDDMIEFSCHGNMIIVDRIIAVCMELGAEPADPGEFTRRAFMNGKMDLTQAEAVSDLIHARSERALRAVRSFQQGTFGSHLTTLRESLLQVLSHLEAHIDFPDEDISPETGRQLLNSVLTIADQLDAYLKTAQTGKFLRQGASVVLAGVPNAGKSSLMNALLGDERVLVSDQPGTTRDSVDALCLIGGFPCFLTDTAGLRESEERIEKMGMERTRKSLMEADVILHLIDGTSEPPAPEVLFPDVSAPVIRVQTKSDLRQQVSVNQDDTSLSISSLTGEGIGALKSAILNALKLNETSGLGESLAINSRHEFHIKEACQHLQRACENLKQSEAPEMISSDLRAALYALAEIIGETSNEDILDRLFQNFCIGK